MSSPKVSIFIMVSFLCFLIEMSFTLQLWYKIPFRGRRPFHQPTLYLIIAGFVSFSDNKIRYKQEEFKVLSNIVVANRLSDNISNIEEKLVIRNLFGSDS